MGFEAGVAPFDRWAAGNFLFFFVWQVRIGTWGASDLLREKKYRKCTIDNNQENVINGFFCIGFKLTAFSQTKSFVRFPHFLYRLAVLSEKVKSQSAFFCCPVALTLFPCLPFFFILCLPLPRGDKQQELEKNYQVFKRVNLRRISRSICCCHASSDWSVSLPRSHSLILNKCRFLEAGPTSSRCSPPQPAGRSDGCVPLLRLPLPASETVRTTSNVGTQHKPSMHLFTS